MPAGQRGGGIGFGTTDEKVAIGAGLSSDLRSIGTRVDEGIWVVGVGFECTLGEIAESVSVRATDAIMEIPSRAVVIADSAARYTVRS